jgi:hypothetical protein
LLTRRQVGVWENGITLFGHALGVTDGNYVAETNLGVALVAAGRPRRRWRTSSPRSVSARTTRRRT